MHVTAYGWFAVFFQLRRRAPEMHTSTLGRLWISAHRARIREGALLLSMEGLEKPQIITHIEKSLNYTVFDVKWLPSSAKVVVLGSHPRDTGALQIYEVSKGELKLVGEVRSN